MALISKFIFLSGLLLFISTGIAYQDNKKILDKSDTSLRKTNLSLLTKTNRLIKKDRLHVLQKETQQLLKQNTNYHWSKFNKWQIPYKNISNAHLLDMVYTELMKIKRSYTSAEILTIKIINHSDNKRSVLSEIMITLEKESSGIKETQVILSKIRHHEFNGTILKSEQKDLILTSSITRFVTATK